MSICLWVPILVRVVHPIIPHDLSGLNQNPQRHTFSSNQGCSNWPAHLFGICFPLFLNKQQSITLSLGRAEGRLGEVSFAFFYRKVLHLTHQFQPASQTTKRTRPAGGRHADTTIFQVQSTAPSVYEDWYWRDWIWRVNSNFSGTGKYIFYSTVQIWVLFIGMHWVTIWFRKYNLKTI